MEDKNKEIKEILEKIEILDDLLENPKKTNKQDKINEKSF